MSGQPAKYGIAAVGQEQVAPLALDPACSSAARARGRARVPGDVVLGVVLDPGVIQARVVGDEVEHQPQAALPEPLAQAGQRRVAAEVRDARCSR